jgi:hypothetical protein
MRILLIVAIAFFMAGCETNQFLSWEDDSPVPLTGENSLEFLSDIGGLGSLVAAEMNDPDCRQAMITAAKATNSFDTPYLIPVWYADTNVCGVYNSAGIPLEHPFHSPHMQVRHTLEEVERYGPYHIEFDTNNGNDWYVKVYHNPLKR